MKRHAMPQVAVCVLTVFCSAYCLAGPPKPVDEKTLLKIIEDAGTAKDYDGASQVYLLDEADVYVQSSGLATTKSCQLIKILDESGIKNKSVLRWEFDPDTYRITIESVRIHRKAGGIDDVDMSGLITQPAPQHMIYWGNQQQLLSIPRLDVGDTLEIRMSKIGFNIAYLTGGSSGAAGGGGEGLVPPMLGHWYEVTLFQGYDPIERKRYSVHMPKDMPVQYEVYNGAIRSSLWFAEDSHIYSWTAENIPAVKREPHMVALDDAVPKLVMATLGTWEEKSRWFHDVNEMQFDSNDDIDAKVAELTRGLKTMDEKIAACTHWVADNIRYYGTKRGACEGFTLHRSDETFRDRGGVCKDKAGMLITMLRVLGVESYAALTQAGSRVEGIPADQFNHTVTVYRKENGEFDILDPTWVPFTRGLWSSLEQEQGLVYGTPQGETLTLSPYYEPEYNMRQVKAESVIGEDGSLSLDMKMKMQGAAGSRFRRAIFAKPQPKQRDAIEKDLAFAPNAKLQDLSFVNPYDYSQDAFVKLTATGSGYAAGANNTRLFRLPLLSHPLNSFFRASFLNPAKLKDRKFGLRFWATRLIRYEETVKLPRGWTVEKLPEPKHLDSDAAGLLFEHSIDKNELTYRFEFRLKKGVLPTEDYAGYKKALDAMAELQDAWVVCSLGEQQTEELAQGTADSTKQKVHHE